MHFLFLASALLTSLAAIAQVNPEPIHLDRTEYVLLDTGKSEAFFLHVINTTDSLVIIEDVRTSCGCIMATPQHVVATKQKAADIYVGLIPSKMSDDQPVTIDVYTNRNRVKPLRLYIRKERRDSTTTTPKPKASPKK